ncbi:ubiquinone biosynthesis O-methyltransferase [Nemania sp. NC0429]|nr:ubiquinone biosynthesis O-methyltransferase [Nemania sp. NC0429]
MDRTHSARMIHTIRGIAWQCARSYAAKHISTRSITSNIASRRCASLLTTPRKLSPSIRHNLTPIIPASPTSPRPALRSFASTPRLSSTATSSSSSADPDPSFTTVSPDEVFHFNALASSWWDPQGPSRILHLMNPLRHDFIRECRASVPDTGSDTSPSPKLRFLDIGCGGGIFAESAARLASTLSVTAIDPSPEVLAVAKAHARRDPALVSKLQYQNTSIEALPIPADPQQDGYDVVTVFEVVEHVANPAAFLDRVTPFVRPGGWLVLSTIARTWTSWVTTNLIAEDLLRIVPRGTHNWNKYINEDELRTHFLHSRTGWAEPRCMGVVYVPGVGWTQVNGSEKIGNYFFAVRRLPE